MIVAALTVWAERLNNSRILFLTDNMALVHIINNCSCKDRQIMCLVRRMVLVSMKFNIHFRAKHVRGRDNRLADSPSRL